jgi:hypothetical protein
MRQSCQEEAFMASSSERNSAEAPPSSTIDMSIVPIEEPEAGVFMDYANVINLDWSLYDVRIRFGELTQVINDADPSWKNQHTVLREKAAIRVPWHQAKNLCVQLLGVIHNYEELNGELKQIKLPAGATIPAP